MNGPGDPQGNGPLPGQGYPTQAQGYPPPGQGYPPQGQGYPPQGSSYPPQGQPGGYPPRQPYPPAKNNTALLITLIVLLVAAIAGGAILYFTGAFGGGKTAALNVTAPVPPMTSGTPPLVAPPVATAPTPTMPTVPTGPVAPGQMTDAQVAQGLQLGVAQFQSRLPLRNGPATITSVTSSGTVLTMVMEISAPMGPAEWGALQSEFQRSLCAGPFSNAISAGASAEIDVTDTTGTNRTYTVSRC